MVEYQLVEDFQPVEDSQYCWLHHNMVVFLLFLLFRFPFHLNKMNNKRMKNADYEI